MASTSLTPSSKRRQSILQEYRNRGRRNNDLFLVYSVKTDQDWLLPSCRQFVHWIYYLETNPEVKSFDLNPELQLSLDDKEVRATQLDAVVILNSDQIEWHEVKSAESELLNARSQLLAQAAASSKAGVKYRTFTDKELRPHVQIATRWLKVIAFAAILQGRSLAKETYSMSMELQNLRSGRLGQISRNAIQNSEDLAITLGLFARLAILGTIKIDLINQGFSYATLWEWSGPN